MIFYTAAVVVERERMRRLFPVQYEKYNQEVPLFFPFLKSAVDTAPNRFSWKYYRKNRELRTVIAALIFWTLFALKYLFL